MNIVEFLKGFWSYAETLEWWQSLIILFVMTVTFLLGSFWKKIFTWIGERFSPKRKQVEYKMFWGLLRDTLHIMIKDELRRSFKENGFYELSGAEFSTYVKDKSKTIISLLKQQIINLYPSAESKTFVSMDDVISYITSKEHEIEDIVFEMFTEGKKCWKHGLSETEKIDDEFVKDIEEFVAEKTDRTCGDCIKILFSKREIAEYKKSKVKVLKDQMNFAEQKLTEIQSWLINFYNDLLNRK